jgi:hypothetical protein
VHLSAGGDHQKGIGAGKISFYTFLQIFSRNSFEKNASHASFKVSPTKTQYPRLLTS